MKSTLLIICLFAILACSSSDNEVEENTCFPSQGISIGLSVKVFNADTGEFIEEGITVKAINSTRTITLQLATDNLLQEKNYIGVYLNQEGTYRVSIIDSEYEIYNSDPITILKTEDGCGLITEHLEVNLQPN